MPATSNKQEDRFPPTWRRCSPLSEDKLSRLSNMSSDTTVGGDSPEDDKSQVEEFSQLSTEEVLERVEQLKSMAYALGKSEAHEMTKGKLLDVFGLNKK